MRRLASLVLCLCTTAGVQADEGSRINDERRALDAQYAQELRACQERFVVTSCVEDARQRWRRASAPLREQELALGDAARQQRAQARQAELSARQAKAASRAASAAAQATRPPAPVRPVRPAASGVAGASASPAQAAERAQAKALSQDAQARERAKAAQAAHTQSELDQQRVAERERQNAAKGKRSDPLPVPPANARP